MAANKTTLLDEFGDSSDWIEIYNGTSMRRGSRRAGS